ncbi:MAG: AAA family ATPase, partial [Oscillospiraceae bacterium]|nr:AAA family ATPase [Oscillospiraceae bacterium]
MKIKKVSTNYFAGISDKSISFGDGINVICGSNESGKSTLVNLISATLFQNAKIDKRSDKEFRDGAFPSSRTDGKQSSWKIDGM